MKCSLIFARFLQFGVIYTSQESKLSLLQNTFMLGENQYESASIYVFALDSLNYVDQGGNKGYDKYPDDGTKIAYCNGIYVNNEDECKSFVDEASEQLELDKMVFKDDFLRTSESQTTAVVKSLSNVSTKTSPRTSLFSFTHDTAPSPVTNTSSQLIQAHSNKLGESDIVFYVIGDAPYTTSEFDPITGFPSQVREIPKDSEFVVHVGDMHVS